jgi:hypothetical protein
MACVRLGGHCDHYVRFCCNLQDKTLRGGLLVQRSRTRSDQADSRRMLKRLLESCWNKRVGDLSSGIIVSIQVGPLDQ